MNPVTYISCATALGAALLFATGIWRQVFGLFAIRPSRMTVKRLGLRVTAPSDVERVNGILAGFAGGFNAMIKGRRATSWHRYVNSLSPLHRPFAHEGAAMGYTLRQFFSYRPDEFEDRVVKPKPEFRYLYYVGLGFWSGMRNHDVNRLERIVGGLDPMHRYLCYDGYGFKYAFFDYPRDPTALRKLDLLTGYSRNAAYQGVGRALFFLYMGDVDALIDHIQGLGSHAVDGAAGLGLAAVFVNPDRLGLAMALGRKLPEDWHPHFHLGMCFGLKARSINDVDEFERYMEHVEPDVREAAYASIRECDRVELLARSEEGEDGYCRWRERVTVWMAERIEYPLGGLKSSTPERLTSTSMPK
ncbi:MAG: DUF1702 family protein [Phycisphaerae bacterium]